MTIEKFQAAVFRAIRNPHPFGARTSDALPLAHKLQREHEADMGAIVRQASNAFNVKHGRK